MYKYLHIILFFSAILISNFSCNFSNNQSEKIPTNFTKVHNQYSSLFSIYTSEIDTIIQLKNPADTATIMQTFFWGKSQKINAIVKINPANNWVALSAVFCGMIDALNSNEKLIGVDNAEYIFSKNIRKLISENSIQSFAINGKINHEKLIKSKPNLVIAFYINESEKKDILRLQEKNIPVIFCQNFLENNPLARAEWIKFFGILAGKFSQACAIFEEIDQHYQMYKMQALESKIIPSVICNAPYSGTWDVPAGESYMAKLFSDANTNYYWKNEKKNGKLSLNIETVFNTAKEANFWINPGFAKDVNTLISFDSRLNKFNAVKNKNVYNCIKMEMKNGANAYWELGVLRCDLVLADLIKIFHPHLQTEHELVFFTQLQ